MKDSTHPALTLDSEARWWLRIEGLAALLTGIAIYGALGGDWLWFLLLLLAPDVSAAGYIIGPRVGAFVYNLGHVWTTGLAVLGAGIGLASPPLAFAGAILIAHVGMDRMAGYGLKLQTGFRDTHLGAIGRGRRGASAAALQAPTSSGAQPAT